MRLRIGMMAMVIVALLAVPRQAAAYVDPGSVSMVLQILFAAAVGMMFTLKDRISEFFRRFRRRNVDGPSDAE